MHTHTNASVLLAWDITYNTRGCVSDHFEVRGDSYIELHVAREPLLYINYINTCITTLNMPVKYKMSRTGCFHTRLKNIYKTPKSVMIR